MTSAEVRYAWLCPKQHSSMRWTINWGWTPFTVILTWPVCYHNEQHICPDSNLWLVNEIAHLSWWIPPLIKGIRLWLIMHFILWPVAVVTARLLPSTPPEAGPSVSPQESSLCSEEVFIKSAGKVASGTISAPETVSTVMLREDSNQRRVQVFTQKRPLYQRKTSVYSRPRCLSKIPSPLRLKQWIWCRDSMSMPQKVQIKNVLQTPMCWRVGWLWLWRCVRFTVPPLASQSQTELQTGQFVFHSFTLFKCCRFLLAKFIESSLQGWTYSDF